MSSVVKNTSIKEKDKSNLDLNFLKEKTSEEKFLSIKLSEVEEQNLWKVFKIICGNREFREAEMKWFDANDLRTVLKKLGVKSLPQQKLDLMIWEVDENLDKRVDEKEFELMYKKCIEDKTYLEPKNLFYMVQFLMYCKIKEDINGKQNSIFDYNTDIVPEDTYFLIYARLDRQLDDDLSKREQLDDEIQIIFGFIN